MSHDETILAGNEAGRTVVRPTPGGRRARETSPEPPASAAGAEWSVDLSAAADRNPLVGCAAGLLCVAAELRATLAPPDLPILRGRLTDQVNAFDRCARARGMTDKLVLPARYFLCALLDESVSVTPWGSASLWSERGLLRLFHNETSGDQKFFDALERLLVDPSINRQLLELMYLCLAMGFEGHFRTIPEGHQELQSLRERLYTAIRDPDGDATGALSPHAGIAQTDRSARLRRFPVWVAITFAAVASMGLFSALLFDLHRRSDPVFDYLTRVGKDIAVTGNRFEAGALTAEHDGRELDDEPSLQEASPETNITWAADSEGQHQSAGSGSATKLALTLRLLLADDVTGGHIEIVQRPLGETIILRGETHFASGRAEPGPALTLQLQQIAAALDQVPGAVLITGHTDSVPIRTLRFPSNQVLSQARADNVRTVLADALGSDTRLTAEGRAATEPLLRNDPRDARNRRVEITLVREVAASSSGK